MQLRMAPPGGLDEQPHPLLGDGFVQEAMHRAIGDLRREQGLLLDASRDDQHQIRELRYQPLGELRDGRGKRRAVEYRDACVMLQEQGGEVDLRARRRHLVRSPAHLAKGFEKLRILRENEQRESGAR